MNPAAGRGEAITDVLVAGAGPTGLTLACDLARRGVAVRIVDRMPAPSGPAVTLCRGSWPAGGAGMRARAEIRMSVETVNR
ncbi:FAD-dependent monooxygenase [Actinoplanes xinjiangensis]|uniref:FAD-dependent monooxygenase n=1 Tax=Actinoplanes xinjiangensis TaxID=512350 RepID=UPI003436231C